MPSSYFFYPPPMPTRLVPPRIYFPIPDLVIGGDSPPITSKANFNLIIQLWDIKYQRILQSKIASVLPLDLGTGDNPPTKLLGKLPEAILQAYQASQHLYIPRTVIHLPIPITQLDTTPPPFTRKDIHIVGKYYQEKDLALERNIYYIQRKYYYVTDNPAPIFTTGYLIAFQPNAFQVEYPGPYNSFQGMNRFISVPLVTTNEFLTIALGPLMREYKQGNAITLDATITDPAENPPRPYNPEAVYLDLTKPDGTLELNNQSMANISTGLYRHTWQSTTDKPKGIYRIDVHAISGNNTAQTIIQGSFRLV